MGYLCANFGIPRPLFSRLRPDVRDRQTSDVRQKHRLISPPMRGGGITNVQTVAFYIYLLVRIPNVPITFFTNSVTYIRFHFRLRMLLLHG